MPTWSMGAALSRLVNCRFWWRPCCPSLFHSREFLLGHGGTHGGGSITFGPIRLTRPIHWHLQSANGPAALTKGQLYVVDLPEARCCAESCTPTSRVGWQCIPVCWRGYPRCLYLQFLAQQADPLQAGRPLLGIQLAPLPLHQGLRWCWGPSTPCGANQPLMSLMKVDTAASLPFCMPPSTTPLFAGAGVGAAVAVGIGTWAMGPGHGRQ